MLAKQASRDKGTVFRSLQRLVGLGFATKQTKILKEGGHYHVYKAVDIETIEKGVDQRISEIQDALSRIRKSFRSDIKKMLAPKAP
jgi:predicted transcriptional regulator